VILAGIFGFVSGVLGTLMSSMYAQIPTGPAVVVILSIIVFFSLFFAPNRGIIAQKREHRLHRKKYSKMIEREKNHVV